MTTISILGKTNVGKSTLFNNLLKKKHSIISAKKNTTVRCIVSVENHKKINKILIDTPGPIIRNHTYAYNTNKFIYDTITKTNVLIIVIDTLNLKTDDFFILDLIKKCNKIKILVINKIDKFKNKSLLLPFIEKIKNFSKFDHIIPVSNTQHINIESLNNILDSYNFKKSYEKIYLPESKYNFTKELIRETLLNKLNKELPYITKINIENSTINEETTHLSLKITTQNTNQKKILIGKNGQKIKQITLDINNKIKKLYKNIRTIHTTINHNKPGKKQ